MGGPERKYSRQSNVFPYYSTYHPYSYRSLLNHWAKIEWLNLDSCFISRAENPKTVQDKFKFWEGKEIYLLIASTVAAMFSVGTTSITGWIIGWLEKNIIK